MSAEVQAEVAPATQGCGQMATGRSQSKKTAENSLKQICISARSCPNSCAASNAPFGSHCGAKHWTKYILRVACVVHERHCLCLKHSASRTDLVRACGPSIPCSLSSGWGDMVCPRHGERKMEQGGRISEREGQDPQIFPFSFSAGNTNDLQT